MRIGRAAEAAASPASLGARLAEANLRLLSSGRGLGLALVALLAAVFLLRVFLFAAAERDDAEQLVFAQSFALGYAPGKTPLYTWLVIAFERLFGVSIFAVELVKFLLLGLLYLLLYRAGRAVLGDARLAGLAALSPLALYYVAWDSVLNYSHTVLLMTLCVASFLALIRLEAKGGWSSYLLLGALAGLGLLAKYNYALFALALALAALTDPGLRARLLNPRILATLVLAAAIALPHALWALDRTGLLAQEIESKFALEEAPGPLELRAKGVYEVVKAELNFLSPLVLLLLLFFWRALGRPSDADAERARHRRLLARHLVALFALVLATVLIGGVGVVRNHYMAILILFPLYAFARIEARPPGARALRGYALTLSLLALAVPAALVAKAAIEPGSCEKCRLYLRYDVLAERLRAEGFERGTIVASFYPQPAAGNLRLEFPDSRVVTTEYPSYRPPALEEPGRCVFVSQPERAIASAAAPGAGEGSSAALPTVAVPLAGAPSRAAVFAYAFLPEGSPECR